METTTKQTMFNDCELIIIDADSPGDEQETVKEYMAKYDNILYHRLDERLGPTPCFNMAIQMANADYITFGFIDDVKRKDCIEILYNEIKKDAAIDLVYGDVAETDKENETFKTFDMSKAKLFEHSRFKFSRENMIKCLPGPMPLWRRDLHEKNGFFDTEKCDYADDWDMWLRAVSNGSKFKKINKIVGLYFVDGRSQQSDPKQRKEEAEIFYRYSHIFGENFHKYKSYFDQFLTRI